MLSYRRAVELDLQHGASTAEICIGLHFASSHLWTTCGSARTVSPESAAHDSRQPLLAFPRFSRKDHPHAQQTLPNTKPRHLASSGRGCRGRATCFMSTQSATEAHMFVSNVPEGPAEAPRMKGQKLLGARASRASDRLQVLFPTPNSGADLIRLSHLGFGSEIWLDFLGYGTQASCELRYASNSWNTEPRNRKCKQLPRAATQASGEVVSLICQKSASTP